MRFRTFSLFLAALTVLSAIVVDAQNASPLAGKWEGAGDTIRIDVPKWRGVWEGKLSPDGSTLEGEYSQQGQTLPLVLRRTGNAEDGAVIYSVSPGVVSR